MTSVLKTPVANAFSKANDRFGAATLSEKLPGPGSHSPKTNFTEHQTVSNHKHHGQTVFGKDERRALEGRHKKFADVPGPGSYFSLGDFGRYQI